MEIIKIESAGLDLRIDQPGIYEMSREQYHADPCVEPSLSRSCIVDMFERSPFHAACDHPRGILPSWIGAGEDDEEEESDPKEMKAMLIGSYADAILMGGADAFEVLPYDKFTTNAAKEAKANAIAKGRKPIKKKHAETAERMIQTFRARFTLERFPEIGEGFPVTGFQSVVIWHENGVWNRAMLDALNKHVWDYKSTAADAHPASWTNNQLFGMGLEMQAAYYPRGYKAVTGESKHFAFAVQEQKKPFDCYPCVVDPIDLAYAQRRITWAQGVWRRGLDSGEWDGYTTRTITAMAKPWQRTRWEEFFENLKTLEKLKQVETGSGPDLRAAC